MEKWSCPQTSAAVRAVRVPIFEYLLELDAFLDTHSLPDVQAQDLAGRLRRNEQNP